MRMGQTVRVYRGRDAWWWRWFLVGVATGACEDHHCHHEGSPYSLQVVVARRRQRCRLLVRGVVEETIILPPALVRDRILYMLYRLPQSASPGSPWFKLDPHAF